MNLYSQENIISHYKKMDKIRYVWIYKDFFVLCNIYICLYAV